MAAPGIVRKTDNGYEVVFERHVSHQPAEVWAMLTEPDKFAMWFCARLDIDGRPGGQLVEHHDHVSVDVFGEITRWEPLRIFEHSWWFGDRPAEPRDSVLWELFPEDTGTRLVFMDLRQNLDAGAIAGRHVCLDVLSAVLDGADPKDHSAPEGEVRHGSFVPTRAGRGLWAQGPQLEQEYRQQFAGL